MTRMHTTLVLGGARSGKSTFAEQLASQSGLDRIFLATGLALDDEMSTRIAYHRSQRSEAWLTIEEPLRIAEAIGRESSATRILVVDCLTLWLSNLMHAGLEPSKEADGLIASLGGSAGPVILVSNEVGLGIVPQTPLGRAFRDAQGRLNQRLAMAVGDVVFVAAGLPLWLKRTPPVPN